MVKANATYDRKVPVEAMLRPDGTPYAKADLEKLTEQYEVRLRPLDGRPVQEITDAEMAQHLLLTDRTTRRQYRVARAARIGAQVAVTADAPGMVDMQLYEVFEGDRHKPDLGHHGDLLNAAWKACWQAPAYAHYRAALRRAAPFCLDAQATALMTELATDAAKLPLYRQLARLPYDVVWLEYDYQEKIRTQRRLGTRDHAYNPGEEPEACGYLLEKIGPTRWRAQMFASGFVGEDGAPGGLLHRALGAAGSPATVAVDTMPPFFVLDTEGYVKDYETRVRDAGLRFAMPALGLGDDANSIAWGLDKETYPAKGLLDRLALTACLDLPAEWEAMLVKNHPRPHERRDKLAQLMLQVGREQAGALRWLCAALATINEVPLTMREVRHEEGRTFRASGQLRPFIVNRVVTLALPKAGATPKRVLAMFRGARRRMARHGVRGHWRRFRTGPRGAQVVIRKWVEPFERGDAALGYVQHSYVVEG